MWGSLTGSDVWGHAGWTMLHYLWVGALLGLGAWASHGGMRRASAAARYVVALGWLGALAVAPIAIAVWIDKPSGFETVGWVEVRDPRGKIDRSVGLVPRPTLQLKASQEPWRTGALPAEASPWHALVTLLPWLWLYPSMGLGFLARKTPNKSPYIVTSLVNHTNFGLGMVLWVAQFRRFLE